MIFRLIAISITLVAFSVCSSIAQTTSTIQPSKGVKSHNLPPESRIPLTFLLDELGEKHNCFFTFEIVWKEGGGPRSFHGAVVQKPVENSSVEQILSELTKTIPNFSFYKSSHSPKIYHLIDTRLTKQKGYALSKTLKSINLQGMLDDLIEAIKKQGISISKPRQLMTDELLLQDGTTTVDVKGTNLKVRDALSKFLPLNVYWRVLWVAKTELGKNETIIRFQGKRIRS